VQILVVVANIQARTLKAEVEKGFLRTAVGQELVDPKSRINLVKEGDRAPPGVRAGRPSVERESGSIFLNPDPDNPTAT